MSDHPLGDIDGTTSEIRNGLGELMDTHRPGDLPVQQPSIVDSVLDLDDFLAGEVRLAEKTARFCTRPELEAKIEDLNAELDSLTDAQGRPLPEVDRAVGDGGRSALVVASEIQAAQREYAAAMRSIRMRQLDEDDWAEFTEKHKKALTDGMPYPPAFYEDLIVRTAHAPKFTPEKLQAFRKAAGHPAFNELAAVAWAVNTQSGVSVPKSSISSGVLRQQGLG